MNIVTLSKAYQSIAAALQAQQQDAAGRLATVQPYDTALSAVNASGMSVSASIANADVSLTGITSYTLFRLKGNATDEGARAGNGHADKCIDEQSGVH
jgi:hypothetical protein